MIDQTSTVLLWSGGKDAMLTLRAMYQAGTLGVRTLLTTVVEETEMVTMHGTPLPLIRAQAEAMELPLAVMRIPDGASNDVYERQLANSLEPLSEDGLHTVAVGDLFLEDIRSYREALFTRLGWDVVFPIWRQDPQKLAETFLAEGYRAVVTSVDTTQLDASFAGRSYDTQFLADLPEDIDPCGEHGAFHTFVTQAPSFREPVPVEVGETVHKGRMARAPITAISRGEG